MEWANGMVNCAKEISKEKEVAPVFHCLELIDGKFRNNILSIPFDDDNEKEMAAFIVKQFCSEHDVIAVLFLTEAWVLENPKEGEIEKWVGRLKEHPKSKEAIVCLLETKNFTKMKNILITKFETTTEFDEGEWMQADRSEGKFANLLEKKIWE